MLPQELLAYFPYPKFRPRQEEVIKFLYESVSKRKNVLLQAMSGFGKTISILTALLPLAEEEDLRIVYLARTHKEHERVIEELRAISRKGKRIMAIALRGRAEMCLVKEVVEQDDYRSSLELCENLRAEGLCKFYKNFTSKYERYLKLLENIHPMPFKAEDIISLAKKEAVCPYELAKIILRGSRVVACSYTYIFNKMILPKFLKQLGASLKEIILVLDEAHNVPDIAMEN
ncbi:MAG: DEAD/DEAH box helicase family protein, partial [Thermoprotei archaeon]|nr:DEAD/DEAH box helicase family protein [Thermoprotei archaeon]